MTPATSYNPIDFQASPDDSIKLALRRLEDLIGAAPDPGPDATYFAALANEFRFLHARVRAHLAADCLQRSSATPVLPAELTEEWNRLRAEHAPILGMLDWLIRHVDSIAEQDTEDKEVFILRAKELVAVLRRHDAEEDRLYAIALWRDTGGES